jgi:hypothetical protein
MIYRNSEAKLFDMLKVRCLYIFLPVLEAPLSSHLLAQGIEKYDLNHPQNESSVFLEVSVQ